MCGTMPSIAVLGDVGRLRALAQAVRQSQNSAAGSSARSAPNAASANQDVLQELERVRARIQELETQLKQSGTAAIAITTESSSQSGNTQNAISPAAATPVLPLAGQSPEPAPGAKPAKAEPFADWTWLSDNPSTKQPAFDNKFFTPEIRTGVDCVCDFNHPQVDTIGGSSEVLSVGRRICRPRFRPDLRKIENRLNLSVPVKF